MGSSHITISPEQRQNFAEQFIQNELAPRSRWVDHHAVQCVSAALYDLVDIDNAYARHIRDAEDWETFNTRKTEQRPPFARINDLLARAGLLITI